MDVMDCLERFNTIFQEMLADLVRVFPNDSELRFYQMAVKAGLMAKEQIVSHIFHQSVAASGMAEKILHRDEAFFLAKDYQEFSQGKKDISQIVQKIKDCWLQLDPENKETIWKYLKVLVLLDRKLHP